MPNENVYSPRLIEALNNLITVIQEERLAPLLDAIQQVQDLPQPTNVAGQVRRIHRQGKLETAVKESAFSSPGKRRSPEMLEQQVKILVREVSKNPGQGVEVYAKKLGVASKDLQLPVQHGLEQKLLSKKGQRRATKYFPK